MNDKKWFLLFLIINLFFFIPHAPLYSQSYQVRTYIEDDGLASSIVYDAVQDHSGCMWFATRAGISFYDGSQWKTYSNKEGLPVISYSKIECDRRGTIWVLSAFPSLNIAYYMGKGEQWQSLPNPNIHSNINLISSFAIASTGKKKIVALGTKGLGLFLWDGSKWENITARDGLISSSINDIKVRDESFYIATDRGISILQGKNIDNTLHKKIDFPSPEIYKIAFDNSTTWFLGEKWILRYEKGTKLIKDHITTFPSFDKNFVILPDRRGGLFYGNLIMIFHYDSGDDVVRRFGMLQGLVTEGATGLYMDREEDIWFTGLRGVSKISGMRFANYHQKHGLLSDETTALWESEPGQMVLGHNDGITFFQPRDNRSQHIVFSGSGPESQKHHRVLDIKGDQKGNLWAAASYRGLLRINKNRSLRWYSEKEGLTDQVNSILIDNAGNLWVGTKQGVVILRGSRFVKIEIAGHDGPLYVRKLFPGPGDSVFASSKNHGVFLFKDNKSYNYRHLTNRDANNVYAVLTGQGSRTWIGTADGLYTISNDTLVKFNEQNFRIDRIIYFIIRDKQHHLWFGTDNGVIRWDGENRQEYTVRQGLLGRETNRSAGLVDYYGRVWIGTDRGLNCYREEYEKRVILPPLVQLLYLEIPGQRLPLHTVNKLKHDMNNLLFRFRAISFVDENDIRFQTKLDGFDRDWSPESTLKEGQTRYTNLSPGSYRFHLRARNAESSYSDVVSSADIIINRPFWMSWWFYVLLLLLVGFGIFSINKYFSRKRYALMLEKQVQEKIEELQKAHDELETRVKERTDELARAYGDLQEQRDRLKSIFSVTPDLLVLMDHNFVYRAANPAFCEFVGKKEEEMIGKTDFEVFPPDEAKIYRQNDIEVMESGRLTILDRHVSDADGRDRWLQVAKTPIFNSAGEALGMLVSVRDITERKKMEEQIKASLKEKEILLKEVHHRVKNNLQVIVSLLNLQSSYIKDEKASEVFRDSKERVRAMALVHEKLYQSNLAKINFHDYIESLAEGLFATYSLNPGQLQLQIDIEDIDLDLETSIPLGLLINELVTNSLKHAFPEQKKGEIRIILRENKEVENEYNYTLVVSDNGISFPEDRDFRSSDSLGMLLVNSFVKQLRGVLELDRKKGTTITIKFKSLPHFDQD